MSTTTNLQNNTYSLTTKTGQTVTIQSNVAVNLKKVGSKKNRKMVLSEKNLIIASFLNNIAKDFPQLKFVVSTNRVKVYALDQALRSKNNGVYICVNTTGMTPESFINNIKTTSLQLTAKQ